MSRVAVGAAEVGACAPAVLQYCNRGLFSEKILLEDDESFDTLVALASDPLQSDPLHMSKKLLMTLLIVALCALVVFVASTWIAPPSAIEAKGPDSSLTVQYVSLATAIVSLVTAIVGLLKGTLRKQGGADT